MYKLKNQSIICLTVNLWQTGSFKMSNVWWEKGREKTFQKSMLKSQLILTWQPSASGFYVIWIFLSFIVLPMSSIWLLSLPLLHLQMDFFRFLDGSGQQHSRRVRSYSVALILSIWPLHWVKGYRLSEQPKATLTFNFSNSDSDHIQRRFQMRFQSDLSGCVSIQAVWLPKQDFNSSFYLHWRRQWEGIDWRTLDKYQYSPCAQDEKMWD